MSGKTFLALIHTAACLGLLTHSRAGDPSPARPARPEQPAHMLYDAAQQRVILLTASRASPRLQMWAWNGQHWRTLDVSGPPVRELGAAASDLRTKRIVIHGGMGLETREDRRQDTWEWDGTAWRQMPDTAPGTRDHHVMAADESRGRMVLFGGNHSGETLDASTWEWDGDAWRQIAAKGPARAHTAMVYDSTRKRIVLFGGLGERYRTLADTWTWNGKAWSRLAGQGPPARSHHQMAFDRRSGTVVLFGGLRDGDPTAALGDTWLLDGDRWRQVVASGPEPRSGHVMAFDPARQTTLLFGGGSFDGRIATTYDDTWQWEGATWSREDGGEPRTRTIGR